MKKFKLLTATVAIILAFSIGCKKEGSNAILNERESGKVTAQQSTTLSPAMQQRLEALYAKIPADARAKVSGKAKVQLQFHPEYRDIIRKTLKLEESSG
jgi:ABC-type phosphate transport system substrate-binding protein